MCFVHVFCVCVCVCVCTCVCTCVCANLKVQSKQNTRKGVPARTYEPQNIHFSKPLVVSHQPHSQMVKAQHSVAHVRESLAGNSLVTLISHNYVLCMAKLISVDDLVIK